MGLMESAVESGACPAAPAKAWRDSQGSLPKTGLNAYLNDNSPEL
jgi:hypothetical protein